MSNNHDAYASSGPGVASADAGKMETAKHEASDLAHTTADKAGSVVDTAKEEASVVVGEAKSQVRDLYAQTKHELSDQARTQQQRLASGMRTTSDELQSMTAGSTTSGLATDLVRQASTRLASMSAWLGEREPAEVLDEVKRFARRKPGTFILAAAVTGVVVGRLTRALASSAADDKKAAEARASAAGPVATPAATMPSARAVPAAGAVPSTGVTPPTRPATGVASGGAAEETPIYSQSSSDLIGDEPTEDGYVRPNP
jgi:hypothetical protein